MVITVCNSFDSSGGNGVGFGAKPIAGMHSQTPGHRATMKSSATNKQPRGNLIANPSVVATSKISPVKSCTTTIARSGDSKRTRASASKRSVSSSKAAREPYIGQSTGGFNKVLNQSPDVKINPYYMESPQTASLSAKHRIVRKRKVENRKPTAVERVIVTASRTATKLLDDLEERHRKESSKERITQCLINLRAASECSLSFKQYQSERSLRSEPSLRDVVGDMGVALFSPIDMEVLLPKEPVETLTDDESEEEEDSWAIEIVVESPSDLSSCPRLLSPAMMEQLADALPNAVKTMTWKRIFALGRDGDAFYTMLHHLKGFQNTIIVVETTRGHILGGYAASAWETQGGMTQTFYGSGKAFLFASHPDGIERSDDDDELHIFNWTGRNRYCQVCDVQEGRLAMGGGGDFGLIVEENLSTGTSGHCGTFGNPVLVPGSAGFFEVASFEVYGFASMGDTFSGWA